MPAKIKDSNSRFAAFATVISANATLAGFSSLLLSAILVASAFSFTTLISLQKPVYAAPLTSTAAMPSNNIVSTTSTYEIVFNTATTGAVKTIEITFPTGYIFGSTRLIERAGIGAGTISASQFGIIYTVTSPVSVAAGTPVRLELARITNTNTAVSNAAISITTKDTAGTIIDGPTTTPITIKNIRGADIGDSTVFGVDIANNAITGAKIVDGSIGTNELANNAVTGQKIGDGQVFNQNIANGAIGTSKLSNTLMYTKVEQDSTCDPQTGQGWCPDSQKRIFVIKYPSLIDLGTATAGSATLIINVIPGQQAAGLDTAPACHMSKPVGVNTFLMEVTCVTSPPDKSVLRYTMISAPLSP